MVYIYSNAERDEEEFLIFKVIKVGLHVNIQLSKLKTAKKKPPERQTLPLIF